MDGTRLSSSKEIVLNLRTGTVRGIIEEIVEVTEMVEVDMMAEMILGKIIKGPEASLVPTLRIEKGLLRRKNSDMKRIIEQIIIQKSPKTNRNSNRFEDDRNNQRSSIPFKKRYG